MATAALMGLALVGCDDEAESGGCSVDTECARGQICESGSCTDLACNSLGECPGTGRTCLYDLKQCSAKECADTLDGIERRCDGASVCVESGLFRFSCVDSTALECGECLSLGLDCPNCDQQDLGMLPVDTDDAGVNTDAGANPADGGGNPPPDAGMQVEARLCAACSTDDQCAGLGEGAKCTPISDGAFCSSACTQGGDECPTGFTCLSPLNQCLPATLSCGGCLAEPCAGGEVCDYASGECIQPREACGPCVDDTGCQDGLTCGTMGGSRYCLAPCGDGCPDGQSCDMADSLCKPTSGQCDACGGLCTGATPTCLNAEARCVECGPGSPCAAPLVCGPNNTCEENVQIGCVGDADCIPLGLAVCFGGECKECLQASDCAPRNECNEQFACEAAPCAGVVCQAGSQCDPQVGRCNPGCQVAADCPVPDTMACNAATGQCYNTDGSCDPAGNEGVCSPGATCSPAFLPGLPSSCSCRKVDPLDPVSPDLIPCQPGQTCLHSDFGTGMAPPDGFCIGGFGI